MSENPEDFAKLVRQACQLSQQTAKDTGQKFGWDDIERIIRQLDEGRLPPESTPGPQSSNPSQFGDRKAIPPTPNQVTIYAASIGFDLDGQAFCDFYESKGWIVGKTKMKDWCAAVRTWKRGGYGQKRNGKDKPETDYQRF